MANAPSKQPNPPTPPEGLRWGDGESGSTRKRIDSSPDVKGVFGEGASVVAVAPPPPSAANADAVANLFRADVPFNSQSALLSTRAKSRGLWKDAGAEGSAPLSPSRVGALPRAVVGRAVTEAPANAVALSEPLPSRPVAPRPPSESGERTVSPQRSLPAARTSLPGMARPSQAARNETPAMRLDLAFNNSQDLPNFATASRSPSNQNTSERVRTAPASVSFQDEATTVKSANPGAGFEPEVPANVAPDAAPKPSLKAPAVRPRSTTPPAAARVSQKPGSLQPTAAKSNSLRLPLILVCAGAVAAVAGFLLAGGQLGLRNSAPRLPTLTVQTTVEEPPSAPVPAPAPAPVAPAVEAKPEAVQPPAADTAPPAPAEPDHAAAPSAVTPSPPTAVQFPADSTPEQQLGLARAQLRGKHPDVAEALLRVMLEQDPDDHHAAEAMAAALLAQGKGAAAVPYAEQIVRKRPKRAPYRVLLGDVKLAAGDRDGAIAAFREALRLEPDNRDAKRRLSTLQ